MRGGKAMKVKMVRFAKLLAAMVVLQFLVFSVLAQAEEVGGAEVTDTAVAVDVIVKIDKDSRAITLKNEEGKEWTFTAGKEVRNFDQLKRGDLVIMEYYSGLAIALEPKGSGLEERVSDLEVDRAKAGEKPGMKVTASTYILAEITVVDLEDRVVAIEGPENTLVLKVSDEVDLTQVEVEQQIEVLYTESYAISVVPAPKVSGTVTMKIKAVAFGIGVEWGEGTLTMYDGTSHDLKVRGLTLVDVGISSVEATGEVYNLVEAKDIEKRFVAGAAGAALVGGGSAVAMKNGNGVVMKLKSTQKGVRLTLAAEGLKVTLK
jgi:Cu/Ag efflux protein CusF